jgi:hypothetical protein
VFYFARKSKGGLQRLFVVHSTMVLDSVYNNIYMFHQAVNSVGCDRFLTFGPIHPGSPGLEVEQSLRAS